MKNPATLIFIFFTAFNAFARSDRGTITGTITDQSGALIPGAKVTLTNVETDTRAETVATSTGNYTLPALPVGNYTLKVEHAGFSSYQQTGIHVQVAVTTRIDVVLQVGESTQSVSVAAEASILKTESAEQSTGKDGPERKGRVLQHLQPPGVAAQSDDFESGDGANPSKRHY